MTLQHSSKQQSSRHDAGLRPMAATETAPSALALVAYNVGDRLLRLPEVARTVGVSRATIYRYVDSGRLPRPVKISTRCIAWRASEITAWMAALQAA
jgi:prophage regulatory protein